MTSERADLHTERLVLHPMTREEAERVVRRRPGPGDRWGPGYPDAMDVRGAQVLLAASGTDGDHRPVGNYEIRRRDDGRAIGGIGLDRAAGAADAVTVGYGLNASARGQGYAAEALRALLAFAWSQGVVRVEADADLDNLASQHVMAAAGMRPVGQDHRVRYFAATAPGGRPAPGGRTTAPGGRATAPGAGQLGSS
ncbi:GNAT family N-acetyltransferase [Streptomyces sp. AA1529]|uniref:GNAT family N-acetyltransferase n=1 Tax=Streptomyces sp. AA1529 TaxID=1203257 RepID=UPI0003046393|nr:GNAT family N-acetyltransferase [Streptomyces sp. AA1529]